jgi:purine-nucleoside phosphorylase
LIDEHIDLMFRPRVCATSHGLNAYCNMPARRGASIYDSHLMQLAESIGLQIGHHLCRGTYGATLGPNYETRAEYRFFRQIGADMVGMSTVPETMTASELGMSVLAFSVITNVAAPDRVTSTNHEEVLSWAHRAQEKLVPITRHLMRTVLLVDGSRNKIEPGAKSST